MNQQPRQLCGECRRLVRRFEIAVARRPAGDGARNAVDYLAQRLLPLRRAEDAPEVFLGNDVDCCRAPVSGEFDVGLRERDRSVDRVRDGRIEALPPHGVIGMGAVSGEMPAQPHRRAGRPAPRAVAPQPLRLSHRHVPLTSCTSVANRSRRAGTRVAKRAAAGNMRTLRAFPCGTKVGNERAFMGTFLCTTAGCCG